MLERMNCLLCYSQNVAEVIDLGEMALAGAFLKPEGFTSEKRYPLRLGFCRNCGCLQALDSAPSLFERYFYRSSVSETARAHFERYAREVVRRFHPKSALEIGSNDGVMLRPLVGLVDDVVGVDPSNVAWEARVQGARIIPAFFTEQIAKTLGQFDLIVANNVLAHVANVHEVMRGIHRVMGSRSVLVFECHYLGSMIAGGQYDAIYHEHVFYHSLYTLQKHFAAWGMVIFDAEPVKLHGGSMRFYVCKPGAYEPSDAVHRLREKELSQGLHLEATYRRFGLAMLDHRRGLCELLARLRREGARIAGYGAAGRANTLMQWCGIDLDYVVDDCPEKHGFYTPGTHIEIRPPEALNEDPPDYVFVTAWSYLDEIRGKCRDLPLIVPMPEPRIERAAQLEAA